jgi:two-component system heavy metal sensor histidine kinase CusS
LRRLTLRGRLTAAFALAVLGALLCFGAAVIAVLWADEAAEQRANTGPQTEGFEDVWKALDAMLAVSPLVIAAAALLGNLLAGKAVAPIREASRRARIAHASGSPLELPRAREGEEWDDLAQTLNALLADARASFERIQRFTADAAHELRNPVTTVLGEADLALRGAALEADARVAWAAVKDESERLRRLLDGLLSLARGDAGQLLVAQEEVDLDALTDALVAAHAPHPPARPLVLTRRGTGGTVRGDKALLRRALENLVENALRHATREVAVVLASDPMGVQVTVSDDGPGIPVALRERVFERFFRVAQTANVTGAGLGLPISRAIAVAHGGTLRCVEAAHGARFELWLPRRGA